MRQDLQTQADIRLLSFRKFGNRRNFLKALVSSSGAFWCRSVFSKDRLVTNFHQNFAALLRASGDSLAARQNNDGSFGIKSDLFGCDPAIAALCGMAFLSLGSLPGRGRYGDVLNKIIDFILTRSIRTRSKQISEGFKNSDDSPSRTEMLKYLHENRLSLEDVDGLIADLSEKGRKPLYGHGFATLFLAEVLGLIPRLEIRETTQAAVDLLVRIQNSFGGWRYAPQRVSLADISITTCQLSALRSAYNAGLFVPKETISAAESFILRLQNKDGGFRYMEVDGPSGYGRTAAAIHALQSLNSAASKNIERAFAYLERAYLTGNDDISNNGKIEYWSYAQFYAALSYWRASTDDRTRERSRLFFHRLTREALSRRSVDGLWHSSISTDAETAFILCALSVPRERLPIFIR